jgi:hypothetical protein
MKGISVLIASPDLLLAFACGFLVTAGIAIWVANNGNLIAAKLGFTLGVSVAGGVLGAGLLTIVALLIDDWSACRLSPVVSWFYGYPLYSTPDTPANGFAYGSVGAGVYLPAAVVALLASSPTAGLLFGQFQAFVFVCIPIVVLMLRVAGSGDRRLLLVFSLCALGFMVGSAPLRYVSFSVHVDAPALCFAALAIWFSAKAVSGVWKDSLASGIFVGLAIMSKQTMIPIGGVCLVLLIFCGWRALWLSALGFASVVLLVVGTVVISGAGHGMVGMYLKFFTGLPRALTLLESAKILGPNLLVQLLVLGAVVTGIGCRFRGFRGYPSWLKNDVSFRFLFGVFFAAAGYAMIGVYTGAAFAADSNHYAPAMYFLLLAIIGFGLTPRAHFADSLSRSLLLTSAVWLATIPVLFFIPRFPGWYLYQNNFLEQAYRYAKLYPGEAYFPWQPLSVLLAEGRLYHLGEQLYYEDVCGVPLRRPEEYLAHLPQEAKIIAIRPFGAPAKVIPMLFSDVEPDVEVKGLPGWQIYRFSEDRLRVKLQE